MLLLNFIFFLVGDIEFIFLYRLYLSSIYLFLGMLYVVGDVFVGICLVCVFYITCVENILERWVVLLSDFGISVIGDWLGVDIC